MHEQFKVIRRTKADMRHSDVLCSGEDKDVRRLSSQSDGRVNVSWHRWKDIRTESSWLRIDCHVVLVKEPTGRVLVKVFENKLLLRLKQRLASVASFATMSGSIQPDQMSVRKTENGS